MLNACLFRPYCRMPMTSMHCSTILNRRLLHTPVRQTPSASPGVFPLLPFLATSCVPQPLAMTSADELLARQLQEEELRGSRQEDGKENLMAQLNGALDKVHRVRSRGAHLHLHSFTSTLAQISLFAAPTRCSARTQSCKPKRCLCCRWRNLKHLHWKSSRSTRH